MTDSHTRSVHRWTSWSCWASCAPPCTNQAAGPGCPASTCSTIRRSTAPSSSRTWSPGGAGCRRRSASRTNCASSPVRTPTFPTGSGPGPGCRPFNRQPDRKHQGHQHPPAHPRPQHPRLEHPRPPYSQPEQPSPESPNPEQPSPVLPSPEQPSMRHVSPRHLTLVRPNLEHPSPERRVVRHGMGHHRQVRCRSRRSPAPHSSLRHNPAFSSRAHPHRASLSPAHHHRA
jgi:hypothetical protein